MTPPEPPAPTPGSPRPAASVVVPTHQRRESLLRLCAALAHQTVPPATFELVVCIDGSSDGTWEALERLSPPYRLRALRQTQRGRAAALNAAIAAADGELLIMLDDDMEPARPFVEAHLRAHADGGRRGVMGAAPMAASRSMSPAARFVAGKFDRHLVNLASHGGPALLTDFYSGNFSLRRALLLEVGGFDESFREYGNEDLELSHRLARAGVRLTFDPDALARQHNDKSFAALARDSMAEGRTAVHFARLHPEVFDRLKLGTFDEGPRPLRAVRDGLLALSRRWPRVPELVGRLERRLARLDPPGMAAFYRLSLGYFYWLGVSAELGRSMREGGEESGCEGLRRLAMALAP